MIFGFTKNAREPDGFSISTTAEYLPFSCLTDVTEKFSSVSGSELNAVKSAFSSPFEESQ
jgi:hypothetical protein